MVGSVLDQDPDAPLRLALEKEGVSNITHLVIMPEATIDAMTYDDPGDGTHAATADMPLQKVHKWTLKAFQSYAWYRSNVEGADNTNLDEWRAISHGEFQNFQLNIFPSLGYTSTPIQGATAGRPGATCSLPSPLVEWKKGVKRDMTLYIELRQDKEWDRWNTRLRATARTQEVDRVLDPNFSPRDAEDRSLFEAQQNYMYAVFERTMLTDTGKTFVRKFESTANAQAIYKAMVEYSQESAQASIDSSTILRYVASARIGDASWRWTSRAFVLNWMDQIRLYEKLIDPRDHLQDGIKLVMLQNAVHDSKPLRDVKDTAIQLEAVSKVKSTYQEYTNLLLAKCSTIDTDLSVKPTRTPKRSVYNTDINPTEDEVTTTNEIDSFGIDCDAHTLLANAHQTYGVHATRMAGKTWHKLSPTAQGIWDQLDDESKALILGQSPESKRSDTFSRVKPGQKGSHRGANKINLHDISAHDLLANYHQYQAHQMDEDEGVVLHDEDGADATDEEPNPLLAFLTSRGDSASPGDLRNVLSSTSNRAATSKPSQQRLAKYTNITYDVGKHCTTHRGALIDRGANGGILGDDARIIAETDRVVNVQGIRDHQVMDLKIVSASGVVDSQHGPVFAIFHQYAHMGSGKSIHSSIQLEAFGLEVNDKSCKVTGGLSPQMATSTPSRSRMGSHTSSCDHTQIRSG